MRAGGGKQKGASFERDVCKKLSLWITHGERDDCFWRSAMSGGRATVANRKGTGLVNRHGGDISAVGEEGHWLTQKFYIECKHVKDLNITSFFLGRGLLEKFWNTACHEAARYGRAPILIARQNNYPTLLIAYHDLQLFRDHYEFAAFEGGNTDNWVRAFWFDELMKKSKCGNLL